MSGVNHTGNIIPCESIDWTALSKETYMDFPVVPNTPATSTTLPLECHGPFPWVSADDADTVPSKFWALEGSALARAGGVYL